MLTLVDKSYLVLAQPESWGELSEILIRDYHRGDCWIQENSQKSLSMAQVRELLHFASQTAFGSRKIIILTQADEFSVPVANALLKIVEEPPGGVSLILLSETKQILPTLLSRLHHLDAAEISAKINTSIAKNAWQPYFAGLDLTKPEELERAKNALYLTKLVHGGIRLESVVEILSKQNRSV